MHHPPRFGARPLIAAFSALALLIGGVATSAPAAAEQPETVEIVETPTDAGGAVEAAPVAEEPAPEQPALEPAEGDELAVDVSDESAVGPEAGTDQAAATSDQTMQRQLVSEATAAAVAAPVLSVSPSAGLDRAGQTVTVTGSGYDPTKAVYVAVCADRELSTVTFDMFFACQGARMVTANPTSPTQVKLNADGTFSFEFAVPASAASLSSPAIFTIRNHGGMADRSQDAKAVITFKPVPPTLSVSPSTGLNRTGQTVTVSGAGYDPTKAVYVAVCADRELSAVTFDMFFACQGARMVTANPTSPTQVKLNADGTFSFEFAVPASASTLSSPAIFTIRNHGGTADRSQDAKTIIGFKPAPSLTVSKTTDLNPAGESLTITGTGYEINRGGIYAQIGWVVDGQWTPISQTETRPANRASAYSAWIGSGFPGQPAWTVAADGSGSFTWTVTVTRAAVDAKRLEGGVLAVFTLGAHSNWVQPENERIERLSFAAAPPNPGTPTTPTTPIDPGTPTDPGTPSNPGPTTPASPRLSLSVSPASVDPSVTNRFTVTGSGFTGAGAANGVYVNIGTAGTWQPGRVPGQGGWLASAWVPAASLSNGSFSTTITVPAGSFQRGEAYGVATFAAHGLSQTDRSLDAWTGITLDGVGGGVAAAAAVANGRTPASAPSTRNGIEQIGADALVEGGRVTFRAEGFQPGETGILVVLYSEPTVLDRAATADGAGVVTWTGTLPYGLSGDHTLTFQGSVSRGLPVTIAAATADGCRVESSSMSWGFKESFRSYIGGSIANGQWTVANGATYETPAFGFTGDSGSLDPETGEGTVPMPGSITFTGHGGVLNTTVSNPVVRLLGDGTAVLLLDVAGTTQEGEPITATAVEFASIELGDAVVVDGELTVTEAPAELTDAGAAAFGTYPAGEALDPVTLTVRLDPACADSSADAAPTTTTTAAGEAETTAASGPSLLWLLWVVLGAVVLAIVIALVVWRRRARA